MEDWVGVQDFGVDLETEFQWEKEEGRLFLLEGGLRHVFDDGF